MATSKYPTSQYTSDRFVESAGAILFHVSTRQVCLLLLKQTGEWILPKGRRNCAESRESAAVREATEETGYHCHLLDVTMTTRATPTLETMTDTPDETRLYSGSSEPFMVTFRHLDAETIKLIWWYIAAIDEDKSDLHSFPEDKYETELCNLEEAIPRLSFVEDQAVLRRAIGILEEALPKTEK